MPRASRLTPGRSRSAAGLAALGPLLAASLLMAAGLACESPPQPASTDASGDRTGADPEPLEAGQAPAPQPRRRAAHEESRQPPEGDEERYSWELVEGDAAYYSADFDQARAHYLEAMALRPQLHTPALGALRTMVVRGRGEQRASIVKTLQAKVERYAIDNKLGASHLLAARIAIALLRPGEALDQAMLAVEQLPDRGDSWRVLGEAAMVAEQWGTAWDALNRAADLGLAAKAGTWERMADVLDEMGELDGAEAAARKAVEMTGSDPHARRRRLNLLALVLKHRGALDDALATVELALDEGPRDPAVLHNAAAIADARGDEDGALKLYDAALESHLVPMTSWRRGHLLLRLDRRQEAVDAFTAAAAHIDEWTWPRSTRWWPAYDVGRLYARAGYEKRAIGWFEDAMRLARTGDATRDIRSWLSYARVKASAKAQGEPADDAPDGSSGDTPGSDPTTDPTNDPTTDPTTDPTPDPTPPSGRPEGAPATPDPPGRSSGDAAPSAPPADPSQQEPDRP